MTRFFPTEVVQHLTRGSYERLIANLEEAVSEESLFEGAPTYVLGTFSGYALVASDEGDCARIKYEDTEEGVRIVSSEMVDLPSYSVNEVNDFLEDESRKVITLWQKGNLEEAVHRLRALASASDEWKVRDTKGALKVWEQSLSQKRPWLKLLDEKKEEIEGALEQTEDLYLRPKFRKLYDGSIPNTDLEEYRGLVLSDLGKLQALNDDIFTQTKRATDKARSLVPQFEEGSAVTALVSFGEDLLADLARIDTISKESPKYISRVEDLGRLHDKMAMRLSQAGVAKNFVETMSNRLSDTPLGGE